MTHFDAAFSVPVVIALFVWFVVSVIAFAFIAGYVRAGGCVP